MQRLILFSVGNEASKLNFKKSIESGFTLTELKSYLKPEQVDELRESFKNNDIIHFWGCKYSKSYLQKFPRVNKGDMIAFAMSKQFIIKGCVVDTILSENLSNFLWDDKLFSLILVIKDTLPISVSYTDLFKEIGYDQKAKIYGLVLVDYRKTESLIQNYGSIDNYFHRFLA